MNYGLVNQLYQEKVWTRLYFCKLHQQWQILYPFNAQVLRTTITAYCIESSSVYESDMMLGPLIFHLSSIRCSWWCKTELRMWRLYLCACDLVSVTKPFVGYSWKLVLQKAGLTQSINEFIPINDILFLGGLKFTTGHLHVMFVNSVSLIKICQRHILLRV